ncbi:AAA family ATPase [Cereibacter azotoformans]|uniref:Peptidase M41-like protein n=1 Tax=Cereibacter azotoformans TaxID=43057 RepID=A0A2T5JT98_9RHOB|nr:AAA family ATPase [Cereibacter azotoformans]AXQ95708.1 AAA family ATPase [Cereibacter sphaeroides]PTR13003.1 peptidase M41-like protein [Cereibacter azotoformans]UIJ32795.1 AAA family ATPase [Cereibacter azotoformans]
MSAIPRPLVLKATVTGFLIAGLLDLMRQGMAEAEDENARREAAERLRRPGRHEALELLMVAALARVLPKGRDLARLFDPGAITLVRPPLPGCDDAIGKAFSGRLLRHLRDRAEVDEEDAADPMTRIVSFRSDQSPRDRASEIRLHRDKVRDAVGIGRPVFLVSAERDLRWGDLAALFGPEVRLPRLSAGLLLEVLSRTHPEDFDAEALRLPEAEALARLAPIAIRTAFMAPTAEAVAERLAGMTKPGAASALTLADVRGQPEPVRILTRMVADLGRWRGGGLAWSEVSASALFFGPPGTGKSMAAEATAGSAGVPFIATSYSACQKMGHQGDMLAELHARVDEAIARAPSVFFIDELDSFLARSDDGNSARYQRGVVNGLLEELSRLSRAEGVLVLGATNHPADVDPAVIRSGRFDLKLAMALPDAAGLEDLLTTGLARLDPRPRIEAGAIAALARRLLGCSGADVAALLRDAASRARAAGRLLTASDLAAAAERLAPPLDAEIDRRVALHEVGHLLVAHLLDRPAPRLVRLTARGGFVAGTMATLQTLDTAEAELATLMGGRAAEVLVYGAPSSGAGEGRDSDLASATRLALKLEVSWRLTDGDGGLSWRDAERGDLLGADPGLRARIEARLCAAHATALDLLGRHLPHLHRIATVLLRERDLDAARVTTLLAEVHKGPPEREETSQVIPFPLLPQEPTPDGAA